MKPEGLIVPERIIINADDFGLTPGVNRGIVECHEAGSVTSTTLLVNGPAAREAVALATDRPRLGVGLHLNLTAGTPVLPPERVPSLVSRDGVFPGKRRMLLGITVGTARPGEIEAEVAAQIERCRELGIEPTHIDSHHHVHAHPRLRRIVVAACRAHGIGKMRTYFPLPLGGGSASLGLAALEVIARGQRLTSPDHIIGLEGPDPRPLAKVLPERFARGCTAPGFAAMIRPHLSNEERSLEVICHPGYSDATLEAASSYNTEREDELRDLLSPGLAELFGAGAAIPISYRDL